RPAGPGREGREASDARRELERRGRCVPGDVPPGAADGQYRCVLRDGLLRVPLCAAGDFSGDRATRQCEVNRACGKHSPRIRLLPPLPVGEGWGEGRLKGASDFALTPTLSQGERGEC